MGKTMVVSNRPYSGCNVVLLWMAPIAVDRCLRLRKIYGPNGEVTTMGADPQIVDGVALMRAFLKLADAADRRKVIELAVALGRGSGTSPPIAPR